MLMTRTLPSVLALSLIAATIPLAAGAPPLPLADAARGAPEGLRLRLDVEPAPVPGLVVVQAELSSVVATPEAWVLLRLPDAVRLVEGERSFVGELQPDVPHVLRVLARPAGDGSFVVSAIAASDALPAHRSRAEATLDVLYQDGRAYEIGREAVPERPMESQTGTTSVDVISIEPGPTTTTVTVKGKVSFLDPNEQADEAWGVLVEVYDDDGQTRNFRKSGWVNSLGEFTISGINNCDSCDGSGSGGIDVRVVYSTSNPRVLVRTEGGDLHTHTSGVVNDVPDGATVTMADPMLENDAFIIHTTIMVKHFAFRDRAGYTPPQADVRWPAASHAATGPEYHYDDRVIHLPETWRGGPVAKRAELYVPEYGTLIHHQSRAAAWNIAHACDPTKGHHEDQTQGCAFARGWAVFFHAWLAEAPLVSYPDGAWMDLETQAGSPTWTGTSDDTPYRVAAAFWDLADVTVDAQDVKFSTMSGVILPTLRADTATFPSFKDTWLAAGRSAAAIIGASFVNTIDYDDVFPTGALVSPEVDCSYVNDIKTECQTGTGTKLSGTNHTIKAAGFDNLDVWKVIVYKENRPVATFDYTTQVTSGKVNEYNWWFVLEERFRTLELQVEVHDYGGQAWTSTNLPVLVLDE